MTKNKYSLQSVLDMRDKAKQQAAGLVDACRARLMKAEKELAQRLQAVADFQEQQTIAERRMMKQVKGGLKAHQVVSHRTHLADLRRLEQELLVRAEQQQALVERAEKELEKALSAFIESAKELQVIEKHRENWRQQKRRNEERREQKINDEVGAIIHERRSTK